MAVVSQPLAGQTILVTGASGAIGSAIVEQLAIEGARPIIHYSRDRDAAERLLDRMGGNGWVIQGDLAVQGGADLLWAEAVKRAGRIDGLVNNAGIRTEVSIEADPSLWRAAWNREFQVNFFSAVDLCREAVKHFRSLGGGRIVNMASRAGQRGYAADALPYGCTKAALINLTKSIAKSCGADGVIAVAIAPGWVKTEMADQFVAQFGKAAAVSEIPIGDMAQPAEIAELVAFVLRPSQKSLNGATLDVNGGSYIR
jgi:NAD(P)-dependent dehydrogenase (short-subunit alcohol dehydrogenase family)